MAGSICEFILRWRWRAECRHPPARDQRALSASRVGAPGRGNEHVAFVYRIYIVAACKVCVCVKWWCVCALRLCVRSVLEFCIFIFVQKKSPSNHLGTLCALREQQGGGTGSAKTGSGVAEEDRPGAPPVGGRSSAW